MRKTIGLAVVLALIGSAMLTAAAVGAGFWKAPPFSSIGINNTYFHSDFVEGGPGGSVVRIWWETGSSTEKCLATLGENGGAPAVTEMYCSSRQVALGDRQPWGLMATLILAEPWSSQEESSVLSINVYQEGARVFGQPMPISCDESGCHLTGG